METQVNKNMTWSDVLQSVFVLPFTAGYTTGGRNRPSNLDGRNSILVFSTFLFSFILLLAKLMTGPNEALFNSRGFHVILSSIAFMGLLSYIALIIVLKLKGFSSILERRVERNTSTLHTIFLWIFGVASVVFCLLKTGRLIECELLLESSIASNISPMECVYYIIMGVFLLVQMILLTYLVPYHFKHSLRHQYWILIIISANLSMCAYGFRDHDDENMYVGNNTWIVLNCTNQTFSVMLAVSEKVLTPAFLECAFLSITLIQNVSSNSEAISTGNDNRELPVVTSDSETESTAITPDPQQSGPSVHINGTENDSISAEHDPLLCNSPPFVSGYNSTPANLTPNNEPFKPLLLYYANTLFSWMLGVAVLIVYLVEITGNSINEDMLNARDVCEALATCMMAIYVHTGYYLLSKHTEPKTYFAPVTGSEYVFIISSIGSLFGCIFTILSFIHFAPPYYKVHVASRVIIVGVSYTQTVFILHAKRCRRKRINEKLSSLPSVLLLLSMYNFVFWVIESFVYGGFYSVKSLEKNYLGPDLWNLRVSICHPLYMYFSFTSALEMYSLFRRLTTHN